MNTISQNSICTGHKYLIDDVVSDSEQAVQCCSQPTDTFQRQALKRVLQQCHFDDGICENDYKKSRVIENGPAHTSHLSSIETPINDHVSGFGESFIIDGHDTDDDSLNSSKNKSTDRTDPEYTRLLNTMRRGKLSTDHMICMVLKLLKESSDNSFIKDITYELGNDIVADMSEGKLNALYATNVANDIASFVNEDWSFSKFYIACNKFLKLDSASRIIKMFTGDTMSRHSSVIQPEEAGDTSITYLETSQVHSDCAHTSSTYLQCSNTLPVHEELSFSTTSNACIQSNDLPLTNMTLQDVLDVIEADNRETSDPLDSIVVSSDTCSTNSANISEYWPVQVRDFIMHSNTEHSNMMKSIVSGQLTPNELVYYRLKMKKEGVVPSVINDAIGYMKKRLYKFKESDRAKILEATRSSGKISRLVHVNFKYNKKLQDICYVLLERSFADTVLRMLLEDTPACCCSSIDHPCLHETTDINQNAQVTDISQDIQITDIGQDTQLIDNVISTHNDDFNLEQDIDINELVDEENINDIEKSIKQDLFNAMFIDEYSPPELFKEDAKTILEAVRKALVLPHDFIYTRKKLLDLGVARREVGKAFWLCKQKISNSVCCAKMLQQYRYAFSSAEKVFTSMPRGNSASIDKKTFELFTRIRLGDLSYKLVNELRARLDNDIGPRKSMNILNTMSNALKRENQERESEICHAFGHV